MIINEIEILDYSPKSIAIRGQKTKLYKETLKKCGARFNPYLKGGAAWIASIKKKDLICRRLQAEPDSEINTNNLK